MKKSREAGGKVENGFGHRRVMMKCSSIGLLRERFRQLDRLKELRQSKDLLPSFSPPQININFNNNNNNNNNDEVERLHIFIPPNYMSNNLSSTDATSSHANNKHVYSLSLSPPRGNNNNNNSQWEWDDSAVSHQGVSDVDTTLHL